MFSCYVDVDHWALLLDFHILNSKTNFSSELLEQISNYWVLKSQRKGVPKHIVEKARRLAGFAFFFKKVFLCQVFKID